jgi:redox-sensitive bicupin YhaK (pirin superfamily)
MITLRRDTDRRHVQLGDHDIWLSFYPHEPPASSAIDLRALAGFDEIQLAPVGIPALHPCPGSEIVSYVYKGALAQRDSAGIQGVVYAGEFQRLVRRQGASHEQTNASRTVRAQMFRISLGTSDTKPGGDQEKKRFAKAQRHNVLCVVASPDGRTGSLRLAHDALVYSSVLDPGQHLIHELLPGRNAWLHVIDGEATVQDIVLARGDGAGVTLEASISLTAQADTEILLIDLGPTPRTGPSRACIEDGE